MIENIDIKNNKTKEFTDKRGNKILIYRTNNLYFVNSNNCIYGPYNKVCISEKNKVNDFYLAAWSYEKESIDYFDSGFDGLELSEKFNFPDVFINFVDGNIGKFKLNERRLQWKENLGITYIGSYDVYRVLDAEGKEGDRIQTVKEKQGSVYDVYLDSDNKLLSINRNNINPDLSKCIRFDSFEYIRQNYLKKGYDISGMDYSGLDDLIASYGDVNKNDLINKNLRNFVSTLEEDQQLTTDKVITILNGLKKFIGEDEFRKCSKPISLVKNHSFIFEEKDLIDLFYPVSIQSKFIKTFRKMADGKIDDEKLNGFYRSFLENLENLIQLHMKSYEFDAYEVGYGDKKITLFSSPEDKKQFKKFYVTPGFGCKIGEEFLFKKHDNKKFYNQLMDFQSKMIGFVEKFPNNLEEIFGVSSFDEFYKFFGAKYPGVIEDIFNRYYGINYEVCGSKVISNFYGIDKSLCEYIIEKYTTEYCKRNGITKLKLEEYRKYKKQNAKKYKAMGKFEFGKYIYESINGLNGAFMDYESLSKITTIPEVKLQIIYDWYVRNFVNNNDCLTDLNNGDLLEK